ncbi:hypothetical protein N7474_000249 [Penicillium riverlandense]|uniref:uncharacterized protein n=1 Tax=Penicillium riverlandense TaxID=1903569 RepID=UPI00254660EF|nr:uncharacterized protein N7474_000249 [Penicillium riverlandense]KAJ5831938.1 hypothetical protein N7474_000249 [Penicillium riverlandense]
MESNTSLSPLPHTLSFPASPSLGPRKRSIHEVDDGALPAPEAKRPLVQFNGDNQENRDPSVSASSETKPSPSVEVVISPRKPSGEETAPTTPGPAPTPAPKKRKLSPASKEAKQHEREAKERQRLEEKTRKEEEKKKREAEREEEKKKREAEREEKKKVKDEEKAAKEEEKRKKEEAKEEEKRKKEEEKEKKSRSQMKLNSFFTKPPVPSASPKKPNVTASPSKPPAESDPVSTESAQGTQTDYQRAFPDFFLQSHTTLAPAHRFERDADALLHVQQTVDACLKASSASESRPFRPSEVFQMMSYRRRRGRQAASVKEILLRMHSSTDGASDVPDTNTSSNPQKLLQQIPIKSLKFAEDVRPPYQGTFTRNIPEDSAMKLSRNPYHRGLPNTNYDYDSEAEWEEPEEGEDLDSEEEDEGSDEGEDDLEGFLDDEDDALAGGKRRLIVGDLEPVCSGIRWATGVIDPEFRPYQIETISETVKFPIKPHSDEYWQKPQPNNPGPAKGRVAPKSLGPQTLPASWGPAGQATPTVGAVLPATVSKAKRPFPPEQLDEFKKTVEGNDLSKIGLVEILKKKFPKVSKDTLKATLDQVAVRVGQKEADKKWVCR